MREDLFERFHRSGKPYIFNGRWVAQTIVRLRYWKQRFEAQRGKKIAREGNLPIMIRNDLTRRRHELLKKATNVLPKRKGTFAFADVNSNLVIRNADQLHPFNTAEDLAEIMRGL